MPVNIQIPNALAGVPVLGGGESKFGKVESIYLDNQTGTREWAAAKTGMFGGHASLLPLAQAHFDGEARGCPTTRISSRPPASRPWP